MNPLLDFSDLPRFDAIQAEHVAPAMDALLARARDALEQAVAPTTPITWADFVQPLDQALEQFGRAWGLVHHLNSVADNPDLRAVFNEVEPRVVEFQTELGQHRGMFERYKALHDSAEFATLTPEQQRSVFMSVRHSRLSGAELESPARERYAAIQERSAALTTKFSEHVLDATKAFVLDVTDEHRLDGLPEDVKAAARQEAERAGKPGWRLTLQFPSYFPVMQYVHDRNLRETLYRAYVTRASELSDSKFDNTPLINELLALRAEEATLLGYARYADVSLVPKMANSPEEVERFLLDLTERAKPAAQRDWTQLVRFAQTTLGLQNLMAWDIPYASERLKEAQYSFSDNEVKQYFQLPKVLDGLFGLIERLFGVQIRPDQAPTWHPDVQFFRIERQGVLVGQFYLDMYARSSKRPGAWMNDARGRVRRHGHVQTPVAYLVCNIQAPVGATPALLSHDEVITLFHEFGHGLHHMLTEVDELSVSGISGVEWDAVELPSQFMENFCWEWDILESMSAHVQTGDRLPRELFNRMLAAKHFQSGLQTLRQIEFSLFDMRLHAIPADTPVDVQNILDTVRREVAVLIPPSFNRFQNTFSHIFAGGYAAGYYSYKWAEVLSADCFAAFEEEGVLNQETGRRFVREILARGGSRPAIDSFCAFRGRPPQLDALLRHNGMTLEESQAHA
jgi:oligopeptidase A